ncbi:MAG: glycosyltransferase family 4 protein [bacterium]|nr:glycosyltransferase family 4 protein [bacterium]
MKVLIATGIYPPQIGGPAQYAKELALALKRASEEVEVVTYGKERGLPTGGRHLAYLLKILPAVRRADLIIALDTFSVGFPVAVAAKILRKKLIIRTGGDFLWEQYVERTGDKVLLRNFYQTTRRKWDKKEEWIYKLTKFALQQARVVVFSTDWQKQIWLPVYQLDENKTKIIENYYGPKERSYEAEGKVFLGATRPLVWKNLDTLGRIFFDLKRHDGHLQLDLEPAPYEEFLNKLRHCYAVILISLGDISPNMILDAIRIGKPFILTKETGLYDRLRGYGLFVDPENERDIGEKILTLADPQEYARWRAKVNQFNFTHTWDEIAGEFVNLIKHL